MGILYIISTPIGNLEDITIRAIKTLSSVDYIACEDTRITGQLLSYFRNNSPNSPSYFKRGLGGVITPKLISYYDEVEFKRIPEIINLLESGKKIALVSDSGTPLISDPGFKLVKECIKRDIKVVPIPGVTSLVTALTVSGLPSNQFLFLGYLPDKHNKRIGLLKKLKELVIPSEQSESRNLLKFERSLRFGRDDIHPTIIFFETPHRIKESLKDLQDVLGDIEIVICRELTKIHEEVWRGKISEAMNKDFKGEMVILLNLH